MKKKYDFIFGEADEFLENQVQVSLTKDDNDNDCLLFKRKDYKDLTINLGDLQGRGDLQVKDKELLSNIVEQLKGKSEINLNITNGIKLTSIIVTSGDFKEAEINLEQETKSNTEEVIKLSEDSINKLTIIGEEIKEFINKVHSQEVSQQNLQEESGLLIKSIEAIEGVSQERRGQLTESLTELMKQATIMKDSAKQNLSASDKKIKKISFDTFIESTMASVKDTIDKIVEPEKNKIQNTIDAYRRESLIADLKRKEEDEKKKEERRKLYELGNFDWENDILRCSVQDLIKLEGKIERLTKDDLSYDKILNVLSNNNIALADKLTIRLSDISEDSIQWEDFFYRLKESSSRIKAEQQKSKNTLDRRDSYVSEKMRALPVGLRELKGHISNDEYKKLTEDSKYKETNNKEEKENLLITKIRDNLRTKFEEEFNNKHSYSEKDKEFYSNSLVITDRFAGMFPKKLGKEFLDNISPDSLNKLPDRLSDTIKNTRSSRTKAKKTEDAIPFDGFQDRKILIDSIEGKDNNEKLKSLRDRLLTPLVQLVQLDKLIKKINKTTSNPEEIIKQTHDHCIGSLLEGASQIINNAKTHSFIMLQEKIKSSSKKEIKEKYDYFFNEDLLDPYEISFSINDDNQLTCKCSDKDPLIIEKNHLSTELYQSLMNACNTESPKELTEEENKQITKFIVTTEYAPKLLPTNNEDIKARMEEILISIGLKKDLLEFKDASIAIEEPTQQLPSRLVTKKTPKKSIPEWDRSQVAPPIRDTALHKAVKGKNIVLLKNILENEDININALDAGGYSALHHLCVNGNEEMIKLLIDKKADINLFNSQGFTPVHVALLASRLKIAKLLIDRGANLDLHEANGYASPKDLMKEWTEFLGRDKPKDDQSIQLFHQGLKLIEGNKLDELKTLLNTNPNLIKIRSNREGKTLLNYASSLEEVNMKIIELLKEKGANIHDKDQDNISPLDNALNNRNLDMLMCFLNPNFMENILLKDSLDNTIFHSLCKEKQPALILDGLNILFKVHSNSKNKDIDPINTTNKAGNTALHILCSNSSLNAENLSITIQSITRLNFEGLYIKNNQGQTPIDILRTHPHNNKSLAFLEKEGVNIDGTSRRIAKQPTPPLLEKTDSQGDSGTELDTPTRSRSPDYNDGLSGKTTSEESLVSSDSPQQNSDQKHWEDVTNAIQSNNANLLGKLITESSVHDINSEGKTALHIAAELGRKEIVELLINKQADIGTLDGEQNTPLDIAILNGNKGVFEFLLSKELEKNPITVTEQSYIQQAAGSAAGLITAAVGAVAAGGYLDAMTTDKKEVASMEGLMVGTAAVGGAIIVTGAAIWLAGRIGYECYQQATNFSNANIGRNFTSAMERLQELEKNARLNEDSLKWLNSLENSIITEGNKFSPDLEKMETDFKKAEILSQSLFKTIRDETKKIEINEASKKLVESFNEWKAIQKGRELSKGMKMIYNAVTSVAPSVAAGFITAAPLGPTPGIIAATVAAGVVTKKWADRISEESKKVGNKTK